MHDDPLKIAGDVTSIGLIAATFADYLPTIAAVASLIWAIIRISETETFRSFLWHITGWDIYKWRSVDYIVNQKTGHVEVKETKNDTENRP